MAFVPPTSIPSAAITGVVSVSNLPADQLVHFTTPVDVTVGNFPVTQPISGSVNVGNFPAIQPVSGTVDVGNFPATQAVSVESLPLPDGAATEDTLVRAAESLDDVGLTALLERETIPAS